MGIDLKPRPAFYSSSHAVAYACAIIAFTLLPFFNHHLHLVKDSNRFIGVEGSVDLNGFLFNRKDEIDILFAGNSRMMTAIDTPYIQSVLSQRMGRPLQVHTVGVNWPGFDVVYALVSESIKNHRVKLVVLSMSENSGSEGRPHHVSSKWLAYGQDPGAVHSLPLHYQLELYASSIMGGLRPLLFSLFPPKVNSETDPLLGCIQATRGFGGEPFVSQHITPRANALSDLLPIWNGRLDPEAFALEKTPLPHYQAHFAKQTIGLLKKSAIPVAILNIPQFEMRASNWINEKAWWPEVFGDPIPLIGVAPSKLFAGLTELQIRRLYYNDTHFNVNGNRYFTQTMLPAIAEIYEKRANKF